MKNTTYILIAMCLVSSLLATVFIISESDAGTPKDYSTWKAADFDYAYSSFNSADPLEKDWDLSDDFDIRISSVQAGGDSKFDLSSDNSSVTITLVVGETEVSRTTTKQSSSEWSQYVGDDVVNGPFTINWQMIPAKVKVGTTQTIKYDSPNVYLCLTKDSNNSNVDVGKVKIKVSVTAPKDDELQTRERTLIINLQGGDVVHHINYDCTGGIVYFYQASDTETYVSDGDNNSAGSINTAKTGDLVRVSPFPSTNGMIKSISIKDANNNGVNVTTKSYTVTTGLTAPEYWYYFFTMPNSDVTVTVEFNSHELKLVSENGSVSKKLVGNFLGPVRGLDDTSSGAGYPINSFQVKRSGDYYFARDVIELTPTPAEGFVFKEWNVTSGGVTVGSDNRFTMGESAVTIEAVFEKVQDQPQVPEASSMTCSGIKNGSNIVLSIQIDGKSDVTSMQDPRLFITVKYGNQGSMVINYYSKPVLTNGSGSDVAIFSAEGLNQVVVQLVDGVTNGLPASYVCWCHYEPTTA